MRRRAELEARIAKLEAQVEALAEWVAIDKGEGADGRLVWRNDGDWVLVEHVAPSVAAEGES
jgi:hypothetical protein